MNTKTVGLILAIVMVGAIVSAFAVTQVQAQSNGDVEGKCGGAQCRTECEGKAMIHAREGCRQRLGENNEST